MTADATPLQRLAASEAANAALAAEVERLEKERDCAREAFATTSRVLHRIQEGDEGGIGDELGALITELAATRARAADLEAERDHWKRRWEKQLDFADNDANHTVDLWVKNRRLRAELAEARSQRHEARAYAAGAVGAMRRIRRGDVNAHEKCTPGCRDWHFDGWSMPPMSEKE